MYHRCSASEYHGPYQVLANLERNEEEAMRFFSPFLISSGNLMGENAIKSNVTYFFSLMEWGAVYVALDAHAVYLFLFSAP